MSLSFKNSGIIKSINFDIVIHPLHFTTMKPPKFHKTTPFLPVIDLQETLSFYRDKLGFYDEWVWEVIDGGIRRDEMRLIFQQSPEYTRLINSEHHWFVLIWFVDNVDEIYNELKQKVEIFSDIGNRPWGIREFSIKDVNGYEIRVAEGIGEEEGQ